MNAHIAVLQTTVAAEADAGPVAAAGAHGGVRDARAQRVAAAVSPGVRLEGLRGIHAVRRPLRHHSGHQQDFSFARQMRLGLVGERDNKLVAYLAATSRKLEPAAVPSRTVASE